MHIEDAAGKSIQENLCQAALVAGEAYQTDTLFVQGVRDLVVPVFAGLGVIRGQVEHFDTGFPGKIHGPMVFTGCDEQRDVGVQRTRVDRRKNRFEVAALARPRH